MWNKVQEMQKELDKYIHEKHGKEFDLNSLILATIVELSEFANDSRSFKYWMNDQTPKESLLEEAADVIHFMASLHNHLKINLTETVYNIESIEEVNRNIICIVQGISMLSVYDDKNKDIFIEYELSNSWERFLGVCKYFGFSKENLFEAYLEKNKINYKRQEEKY